MLTQEIHLSASVQWFSKPVKRVFLREPRASHLQRFGEPRMSVFQTDGTGTRYWVERDDVIGRYLDELMSLDGETTMDGGGLAFLTHIGLANGIALREALFDFFYQARVELSSRRTTSSEKPTP
jgi:hypothetical protein